MIGDTNRLGRLLLEIVYPGMCLCCGNLLLFRGGHRYPVCRNCQEAMLPLRSERRCQVCSIPLISELQCCTRCVRRGFAFASNFSVYEYRGPTRQIISQFKFSNRRSLAPVIAHLLQPTLDSSYQGLPVVPVPGSRRSVRRRGWDPMLEVARSLHRNAGTEVLRSLKRRSGGPQKGLDYEDRVANIHGTIELRSCSGSCSAGIPERVVLIDDIFTSGATADECARVLCRAGVRQVEVLTLAMEM